MPLVFVYGTLKRGDCRHRFLAGSKFLGLAATYLLVRWRDVRGALA